MRTSSNLRTTFATFLSSRSRQKCNAVERILDPERNGVRAKADS
jgi:hypothetical protein